MGRLLDGINYPDDVKNLNFSQLDILSEEIREFLIDSVSKTGGHLASNLGVVELTLAIHKVFDLPEDKLVWDVGHQAYVHKILTGRKDRFDTLRKKGGLSGFPKRAESEYDCFDTGHSSTSISAALGLAKARDIEKKKHKVIAVIGDGALTGGLAYEALCNAGRYGKNFIVILNDNAMSISENVGAVSEYLAGLRIDPSYLKIKHATKRFLSRHGWGKRIAHLLEKIKNKIRRLFLHQTIFEDLGFTYLGPVDGHDIRKLTAYLNKAKTYNTPVLIHACTIKGKGYSFAEQTPQNWHGVSTFDTETGETITSGGIDYSAAFGQSLCEIAKKNEKVVAISPAMTLGSGLSDFARVFPKRFFDVGIAESHAVTFAAGMAAGGFTPVISVYSSFLQRSYDQIIHDVCLQNLHVVFCVDRAGVVGADGETHQGIFDISYMSDAPNMTILAPSNFDDLEKMLDYAVNEHKGPIAIRYPRGNMQYEGEKDAFSYPKADVIKEGSDVSIVASGVLLKSAVEAAEILEKSGISAEVIFAGTIKPLDEKTIIESAKKTKYVITLEDNMVCGGFGGMVCEAIAKNDACAYVETLGYNEFVAQCSVDDAYRKYCLDARCIADHVISLKNEGKI